MLSTRSGRQKGPPSTMRPKSGDERETAADDREKTPFSPPRLGPSRTWNFYGTGADDAFIARLSENIRLWSNRTSESQNTGFDL